MGCTGSKNIEVITDKNATKPTDAPSELPEESPPADIQEKAEKAPEKSVLLADDRNVVRVPEEHDDAVEKEQSASSPAVCSIGEITSTEQVQNIEACHITEEKCEDTQVEEVHVEVVSPVEEPSESQDNITPLEEPLEEQARVEEAPIEVIAPTQEVQESPESHDVVVPLEEALDPVIDNATVVVNADVPDTSLPNFYPNTEAPPQEEVAAATENEEVTQEAEELEDNLESAIVEDCEMSDVQNNLTVDTTASTNEVSQTQPDVAASDINTDATPSDLSPLIISPITENSDISVVSPHTPHSDVSHSTDEGVLSSANNTDIGTVDNSMYHGSKPTQRQSVRDIIPKTDPTQPLSRRKSVKVMEYEEAIKGEKELAQQRVTDIRQQRNVSAGLVVEEDGKVVVALSEQERVPIQAVLARASSYEPKHDVHRRTNSTGSGGEN